MTPLNYRLMADISSNNPYFDPAAYASAGHVAIAIKATEWTNYINHAYAAWVDGAHNHRLSVTHYHFCRPEDGAPIEQMQHFWQTVRSRFRRPADHLALDVETGLMTQAREWLAQAYTELHRLSDAFPWVYCPLSYYEGAPLRVPDSRYWLAAWGSRAPVTRRGDTCVAWQYTDGQVGPEPHVFAGIGVCDGSVLQRKLADDIRNHLRGKHDRNRRQR